MHSVFFLPMEKETLEGHSRKSEPLPAYKGSTWQRWRGGVSLQAFLEEGVQQSKVCSPQLFIPVGCCLLPLPPARSCKLVAAQLRRGPCAEQDTLARCLGNVNSSSHPHTLCGRCSRPVCELSANITMLQAYYCSLCTWTILQKVNYRSTQVSY